MNTKDVEQEHDEDTLEHLMGVVVESRETRCAEIRQQTRQKAAEIVHHAHARSRGRLHRHVVALKEKYRVRTTSATAHNMTLLRQQHQKENRAVLDMAWPRLQQAMIDLWQQQDARHDWIRAAINDAQNLLRKHHWEVEHPQDMSDADVEAMSKEIHAITGKSPKLHARQAIKAGVRINFHGTVIDATIDGLLHQRERIEAELIARIKQGVATHD